MAKKIKTFDWLLTTYGSRDKVIEAIVIKDRIEKEAENESMSYALAQEVKDHTLVKMQDELKRFCEEWGQNDNELALALDLDADDDGFSEMAMNFDYVWIAKHRVWVSENNRLYDKRDDVVIEYIKANR